jgi:hypothetical protein
MSEFKNQSSMHECHFSIADIGVRVCTPDPKLKDGTAHGRQDFIVHHSNPDATVFAEWNDSLKQISGEPIFDSGALWKLYFHDDQFHFSFNSPVLGSEPYKIASFNTDFTCGHVSINTKFYTSDKNVDPLEYPLDELLILHLLSQGLGVEVHSCGLIDSSQNGFLFAGQSGAGKTTIARLMQKAQVKILSDDRIILRRNNGKMWMHGTPWHGESKFAAPSGAELKQIFFLKQDYRNEIVHLKESEAVARLFACSFPLFYKTSAVEFMLTFFEAIVRKVPCLELRFVNDDEIVEFLSLANTVEHVGTVSKY